jgi:NADH-quinone oxidoreductase subunit N
MTDFTTLYLLGPEMVLVATATAIYLAGAFFQVRGGAGWLAAAGILLAAGTLLLQDQRIEMFSPVAAPWLSGPLVVDWFGHAARWGVLLLGLLLVMIGSRTQRDQPAEYFGTLLLVLAGLMIAASASELILLFLGLELVSIPTYILLYLGRRGAAAQEATTKDFFLSVLSSALLLYGFSFLYGATGTMLLPEMRLALLQQTDGAAAAVLTPVGLILVLAGLGFRLTIVPFHFYAPDVYQGTSNLNAGLLSTLPKVAGLLVLVRLLIAVYPEAEALAWKLALVLAILTMTLGNLLALWQDNLRRLLAYSSIAHAGYILVGLAVGMALAGPAAESSADSIGLGGIGAALFYLAVYCLATLGAFAALVYLGDADRPIDGVDDLAGLGETNPLTALGLTAFMFSLAGVPPLVGFWGKLALFGGALEVDSLGGGPLRLWFVGLAVIGVLNAAVAAAYYLRIVAVMYFRSPLASPPVQGGPGAASAALLCAVLVVAVGLFPGRWMSQANRAGRSAWRQPVDVRQAADAPAATGRPLAAVDNAAP